MDVMTISIDTREQAPWAWPREAARVVRRTIGAGDYAVAGDEERFAIERKSLNDFVATVTTDWERFQRELRRMAEAGFPARVVVVEGTLAEVIEHQYPNRRITPAFVMKRLAQLSLAGVSVLFAGGPEGAAAIAWHILRERAREIGR